MPGKKKVRKYGHPLYVKSNIAIFPGSLMERSGERLVEDATRDQITDDMTRGGVLVEQFVDNDRKLLDFSRPDGREIFFILRRIILSQGRIGDPIPNKELEKIAADNSYLRIRTRFSLRDAWKMGISRRFVRGVFNWGKSKGSGGGQWFGVHYILVGSGNARRK